jgi:hypothetical protein
MKQPPEKEIFSRIVRKDAKKRYNEKVNLNHEIHEKREKDVL